ncbi:Uncharacterised protein [Erysipelatoclostridium ramosum]|uniref:Uncharacterized protein n=2 Tax=Thomasclavelia ramosa TaxID=1547 RepID=A0A6N3A557_9FIRM
MRFQCSMPMHLPMSLNFKNISEVKAMKKEKEVNKNKDKKQIADDYSKKITYSTSKNEQIDLLDIIEMYLCKACIKL